jgi:hypothetical protein
MEIAGVSINDARLKKDIVNTKEFYRIASVIKLQNLDPQKVTVLPCGEVLVAKG